MPFFSIILCHFIPISSNHFYPYFLEMERRAESHRRFSPIGDQNNWNIWHDRLERSVLENECFRHRSTSFGNLDEATGGEYERCSSIGTSPGNRSSDELESQRRFENRSRINPQNRPELESGRSSLSSFGVDVSVYIDSLPGPTLPDPEPWCSFCKTRYQDRWQDHKDVDWKTGEYRCAMLVKRIAGKKDGVQRRCTYCVKAEPTIADTHFNRCPITKKVTCPLVRSLPPCQKCGAYGDKAHTTGACPETPDLVRLLLRKGTEEDKQ